MKTYKSTAPQFTLKKNKTELLKAKISNADDAEKFARQFYGDDLEIYESFFIMLLNNANNTIGWCKISQGGLSATVVDVRLVAKIAVESLASAVILVHNHPSGSLEPSHSDKQLTDKIQNGLKLLDINVLDHVILTKSNFYSFSNNGDL